MWDQVGWVLLLEKLRAVDTSGTRNVVIDVADWGRLLEGAQIMRERVNEYEQRPIMYAEACAVAGLAIELAEDRRTDFGLNQGVDRALRLVENVLARPGLNAAVFGLNGGPS